MTKQEQIEEMKQEKAKMIKLIGNVKPFYVETIAEALYDAGYRKVLFDVENGKAVDVAQYASWELMKKHIDREVEKARKETAREILQTLYDKCYEIDNEYDESIGNFVADDDILCLAKHYGVEVEK